MSRSKPTRVPGEQPPAADTAPVAAPASPDAAPADVPNAIDVDATKIGAPVLTRQGWVCPAEVPRHPASPV